MSLRSNITRVMVSKCMANSYHVIPHLGHHGLQDAPRRPRSPPRRLQSRPRGYQMLPRRPRSPPRPSRRPPKFSRCLQDAQYRFQDRPKCSEAVSKAYLPARLMPITARFLPSPCQVHKYSRDVFSAVVKHNGRLPWPWPFTKGGLAVSAR